MSEGDPIASSQLPYSFTTVIAITGVNRETIIEYCEHGVLPLPADAVEQAEFDDDLVNRIRRIERLRLDHGVNLAGIRMILQLWNEVEELRRELKFRLDG